MADNLTFVIQPDAQSASIDLFLKCVEDIRNVLRDVDYAIHRERTSRRWVIRHLESSSPTLIIEPLLGDEETVGIVFEGIRAVTTGTDYPPQYFTEDALLDLRNMRRLFKGRDRALAIRVSVNSHERATIRGDISDKASRILMAGYHNWGSLEGNLEAINYHRIPVFTIWDRVSRFPVRCSFPNTPEWKERVKNLLEKRVTVRGTIHYFINGVPRVIRDVQEVEDTTPDPNLPRAEFGSIPDGVASHDPAEFLRSIRGAV